MKWVLLYATLSANGVVATGSAEFANADACFAAQRAQVGVISGVTSDRPGYTRSESTCVNTETGERRSAFKPQP